MCCTADSLMLTKYFSTAYSLMTTQFVRYSRQIEAHTICDTADSLMLTQNVRNSRQFNSHTIFRVQKTVKTHTICVVQKTF